MADVIRRKLENWRDPETSKPRKIRRALENLAGAYGVSVEVLELYLLAVALELLQNGNIQPPPKPENLKKSRRNLAGVDL